LSGVRAAVAIALIGSVAAVAGCGDTGAEVPGGGGDTGPTGKAVHTWGEPSGDFAGRKPTGVVLLIHGGGWQPDPAAYDQEVEIATLYQRMGYATGVIGYRAGAQGLHDIVDFYAKAAKRYPHTPICAVGASAGGNLALLLAAREPDISCVIDLAGPTDLTTLERQGGDDAHQLAVTAFGADRLSEFSPVNDASRIKAKVLMIFAEDDPVVPEQQGTEMAAALPSAKLIILPPGPGNFVHGPGVDEDAKQRSDVESTQFLQQALGSG
jgi:dipeptidyl aminopeptidase/acylaminoacyl peptidase